MIITRSPLRISLGGGGTDLPSYYSRHGGFLIAGAIDKYVYITIHRTFVDELIVKYSKLERVPSARELQHPIIREALALVGLDGRYLELTSMADIPAGTGLGSSGSFTTALLKALHTHQRQLVDAASLAEQACHIEIERLGEPIGKQDQYVAACGGLAVYEFAPDGRVTVTPLRLPAQTLYELEANLLLFFTGYTRAASDILREQDERSRAHDPSMIDNLHEQKRLGLESRDALESGDLLRFARIMNEHWHLKRQRSRAMSSPRIDAWYERALASGAVGGKLIGAGGGGFLLFYAQDTARLRRAMEAEGLTEVRCRFDFEGTKVVIQ